MKPIGRDVPPGEGCDFAVCPARDYRKNVRHLWSVHDNDRVRTDPAGWAAHVASCNACSE